jgi:Tol biopolymer transport system component
LRLSRRVLHRVGAPLFLSMAFLAQLVVAAPRVAAAEPLCFSATGFCIEGRFREYWEAHGGLAVFGLPVTAARPERSRDTGQTYLTQWFERNRFELHPENPAPFDVLLGRLGDDRLRQSGVNWQGGAREPGPRTGCLWFSETGFNVCDQSAQAGFKRYWQTHGVASEELSEYGRSLALFGLPLTSPRTEHNASGDTVVTQWFERARFEWHPNEPDEFKVLLGLLGNDVQSGGGVVNLATLSEQGGRLDWSPKGDLIAFDRAGVDGYTDVYTMRADGTGATCLTCGKAGIPNKNNGNPAWHPTGSYLVFQAEKQEHEGSSLFAAPGFGIGNDLWMMTPDGNRYYQLTDVAPGMGVIHAHFAPDGRSLAWAEKVGAARSKDDNVGAWAIKLATLVFDSGVPRLANVRAFQPFGDIFYESHGFSPDGAKLTFSAFIYPNASEAAWMDTYRLDIATGVVERLTASMDVWDEFAHYSPSGRKIVWMSSADCGCNPYALRDLRTDLWIMNADTSEKMRLTRFSDPASPGYIAEDTFVTDSTWSPDGRKLAFYLVGNFGFQNVLDRSTLTEKIMVLEFNEPQ